MTRYLQFIVSVLNGLLVITVGCAPVVVTESSIGPPPETTPTPVNVTPAPTITFTPTITITPIERMVPYDRTSIWNTPIGVFPKYDQYSEEMVANLVLSHDGRIITPDTYNYPVYFADADSPRWNIPCITYLCAIATEEGGTRTDILPAVPIPPNAIPSQDSDGRMIIIDTVTYAEYDLWRANFTGTGWTTASGSIYNILWNGTPATNNSRGSGTPTYAGLIRPWEIVQGRIDHALAFGYTEPARDKCVFPASKTDGDSTMLFAIPEGARLQLDPFLTEQDFERIGLDRTGKLIARTLQEYGMILVDNSGSFKIYLEDLTTNPFTSQSWTDPELNVTEDTISSIPYTSFRVLEMPPGYWNTSDNATYHGECLTFPGVP